MEAEVLYDLGKEPTVEKLLEYGMNPHQEPARAFSETGIIPFEVLNGTPGYINLLDGDKTIHGEVLLVDQEPLTQRGKVRISWKALRSISGWLYDAGSSCTISKVHIVPKGEIAVENHTEIKIPDWLSIFLPFLHRICFLGVCT